MAMARRGSGHLFYDAFASIAGAEAELGNFDAANDVLHLLPSDESNTSMAYAMAAQAMARRGHLAETVKCMNNCVALRSPLLRALASVVKDQRDQTGFLVLLPFLTEDVETTLNACVVLANLFPESAGNIAELIAR